VVATSYLRMRGVLVTAPAESWGSSSVPDDANGATRCAILRLQDSLESINRVLQASEAPVKGASANWFRGFPTFFDLLCGPGATVFYGNFHSFALSRIRRNLPL